MRKSDSLSQIPLKIRRSNSMSQIPIRGRGSSMIAPREKRSTSIGRPKDSMLLLKPKRTASPESQINMKQTPLSRQRSLLKNTPRSALRITPGSVRSTTSSYSRVSPASGLIERKTIQKLSTNKVWVAKQYEKVQKCISNADLFDQNVVTTKNIKPPSIKVFIYIVTTLLSQLFDTVKISTENYKEEIPRLLNCMNYPGTLTKSTLKTVNTMHSWPQVIGILGWLVDKVTIVDRATKDHSELTKEEQQRELNIDFLLTRYDHFCNNQKDEDEVSDTFFKNLTETLGIDTDNYKRIKKDHDTKNVERSALQKEVEELEQVKKTLSLKHVKIVDEFNELQGTDSDREAAVESELKYYPTQLQKLTQKENELTESVLKLEESIKTQSCTYQEKQRILKRIETMNSDGQIYKEKIDCVQQYKQELEAKILGQREKIQSHVIAWNKSLMLICIKKPHLKQLLLKETGFHRDEFLKEIREIAENKLIIETEVENKVKELETEVNNLKITIETTENELKEVQSNIDSLMEKLKQFSNEVTNLKNDKAEKQKSWELKKEKLLSASKELKEDKQLKSFNEEFEQLKQKQVQVKEELEVLKKTGLNFFIELNEETRNHTLMLKNIVEDVKNKVETAVEMNLKEKNRLNDCLKSG